MIIYVKNLQMFMRFDTNLNFKGNIFEITFSKIPGKTKLKINDWHKLGRLEDF